MKLIYKHYYNNGVDSWTIIIPFEYESKEKFCYDVFEFWKKTTEYIVLFGLDLYAEDMENLEYNVFTLEEWFENNMKSVYFFHF